MVTLTNHVIAGPDLHRAIGPWHFGDFRSIFLGNIGEDQKKSLTILAQCPKLVLRHIMVNPVLINALRSQKG